MNEEYFDEIIDRLETESLDDDTQVGAILRNEKAIPILKRIARDQREADVEKIKSLVIFLEGGDNYTKDQCVFNETLAVCIAALREEDR